MKLRAVDDPAAFLDTAGPFLLEDEARHNLILGIAGTLRDQPSRYREHRLWLVENGAGIAAAALRTPPFNLVLARPRTADALDVLAAGLEEELPGVVGAVPEVGGFVDRWTERTGRTARTVHRQGIYALAEVLPVPEAPGRMRRASGADRELLLDWWRAFAVEALHEHHPDVAQLEHVVDHRLAAQDGGVALWEDGGRPVSLSGFGGPTPHGIRIGPVYTPPELRGRGYASSLVARLSAELLSGDREFCFLYTDLANPTSNRIYERIGYRRVCESAEVAFE